VKRVQLRGTRGGDYVADAPDVIDIDAAEEHSGVPSISPDASEAVLRAANFTQFDCSAKARAISPFT
jgi:hypothetical protein